MSLNADRIRSAWINGRRPYLRPEPQPLAEWANDHFYLSSESSYVEGRWETLPFQVAPMNAIGHPDIREVNFVKSARVGYSQMIRAAIGYFTAHKARNQILYQPTDAAAGGFMKAHVETMVRDVPDVRKLAEKWLGKKHRDSTLDMKRFSNGKLLYVLGGASARNYREKSADCVYYDELSGFDQDIEKEGDPTTLGDKRIEGSVFPKSIRGSTPKLAHNCQISKAASDAECYFRFNIVCPHCGHETFLKWGGKDSDHGFKWQKDQPQTVGYVCESCSGFSTQQQIYAQQENARWVCEKTGIWTDDGLSYFGPDDDQIDAPSSVAFHIWTAYSPFTTWTQIVRDWLKIKGDPGKLKTFVNTTLGETWEEQGEKLEGNDLFRRREHYKAPIPVDDCILTAAVDVQDDRLEVQVEAWAAGEENWKVEYVRLYGDLSRGEIWQTLHRQLSKRYETLSGTLLDIRLVCLDSGGHYTDEVYDFSKRHGLRRFIPIKGHSQTGKPVIDMPRQRNRKGVYLAMVGPDTAKEILSDRLKIADPGDGYVHFPVSEQFDETYFIHLTNERRTTKFVRGKRVTGWDAGGRRNEPWDLSVYNLAAIRLLQQNMGVKLDKIRQSAKPGAAAPKPTPKKPKSPQQGMNLESSL